MSVPLSRLKANANYQAKAYDKVTIAFKKGKRDYYKAEAAKRGLSLASLIQTAVEKYIEDTASKPESPT